MIESEINICKNKNIFIGRPNRASSSSKYKTPKNTKCEHMLLNFLCPKEYNLLFVTLIKSKDSAANVASVS